MFGQGVMGEGQPGVAQSSDRGVTADGEVVCVVRVVVSIAPVLSDEDGLKAAEPLSMPTSRQRSGTASGVAKAFAI